MLEYTRICFRTVFGEWSVRSVLESMPVEGKRYRVEYLENTKIVVSLVETD